MPTTIDRTRGTESTEDKQRRIQQAQDRKDAAQPKAKSGKREEGI